MFVITKKRHLRNGVPHKVFGSLLATLRQKAGIPHQSQLAKLVKSTQQTVSRWELGLSRPRHKQMSLLAAALNTDLDELLSAAGYTVKGVVATFDQPFPVDALTPDSFERFCLYFLSKYYPTADVHRAGGSGHSQEGLDVAVIFPDKTCYSFQCKRVGEFGPQKVRKVVAKHSKKAKKKFILLTRVASPLARNEVRVHATWDIWDKEDIALHVRELPKNDQLKLVDTFFRGQRLALLGETEPGPWQTSEEFFEAFMTGRGAFSHAWKLVGRIEETRELAEGLANSNVQAVFLMGAGGVGKTRALKQAMETFQDTQKAVLVRFLSPSESVTNKSLEDLGDREKVLVVDDAHDRRDMQLLFQYASVPSHKTTLLLSFRPYGLSYIKAQASSFALAGERILEVKLDPLNLEQAKELATQVLHEFGGPEDAAENIARLTLDCPLATVIGAQIVAKDRIHLELAKNKETFRSTLLGRFQDIVAGDVGSKSDGEPIRKLLKVLALLQPFHPEDESLIKAVEQIEKLRAPDVKRLIRLLSDAGVLFKRGGKYRLSPDLLADHIIEGACIGQGGTSTGYAEQVFVAAGNAHVEHLLLNLGKLDWRLANGDPSNSRLLDGVWGLLKPSSGYSDPHINAVTAVAYYQPARALSFAEQLIREGNYLRDLPNLIKYAAYNLEHLPRACECLWEIGKSDARPLNSNHGHAIRILSGLCAVEPNKPITFNEVVADFGLSLLDKDDSWKHAYSPFDVLNAILETEGSTTKSNGRSISFGRFSINFEFTSGIRGKVINATIKLLSHQNVKVAVLAARFLHAAVRYSISGGERKTWTKEFIQTLEKIERTMREEKLDPLVLVEIARSVSWHANFAEGETTPVAKRIIASLPASLAFRTTLTLIDGFGHILERKDHRRQGTEWNRYIEMLANDLLSAYQDGECLRVFIENILGHIEGNGVAGNTSPYVLFGRLVQLSPPLAQATAENALKYPDSRTLQFAGMALSKLLIEDHDSALKIATRFLDTECRDLHAAVGRGYGGIDLEQVRFGEEDLALLQRVLTSNDQWVVNNAVGAIRTVARNDERLAIDLLKCVDIGMSSNVADEVLVLFARDEMIPFPVLTGEDIDHFLGKLMRLPELDEYWIEAFISKVSMHDAVRAATFFMARVERAADTKDWHYRPCNHGPYCHVPLRFRESPKFRLLLRQVSQWMKSRVDEDYEFQNRAGELFCAMFAPFDSELIAFLEDWIDVAMPNDIRIISRILHEASPNFVFEHRPFVVRFLEKANEYGKIQLEDAVSDLYGSAITGVKSGTPGEPFPQDLSMKEEAENALKEIPRFSSAYRLYDILKKHAEHNIGRSLQERENFED